MNSGLTLLPQVWSWYVGFFVSMGSVIAVAMAFIFAVITTHWLYLCAHRIESKPTSPSFSRTMVRLSAFQALVIGVILVPFCTVALYYLLFTLVWKLAPAMPSILPTDAPLPEFGSESGDQWFSSMTSLLIYLGSLTVLIAGGTFFLLRNYARKIDEGIGSMGIIKRVLRRYFYDSIFIGCLLTLIACPVLLYFLYNMALLVMLIVPSTADQLPRIAFRGAENMYIRSLEVMSSWLIVILFIPAFWLFLRGIRLGWRYTIENPTMKAIFVRSIKFSCLGLFGFIGCAIMHFLAHSLFKLFVQAAFR